MSFRSLAIDIARNWIRFNSPYPDGLFGQGFEFHGLNLQASHSKRFRFTVEQMLNQHVFLFRPHTEKLNGNAELKRRAVISRRGPAAETDPPFAAWR